MRKSPLIVNERFDLRFVLINLLDSDSALKVLSQINNHFNRKITPLQTNYSLGLKIIVEVQRDMRRFWDNPFCWGDDIIVRLVDYNESQHYGAAFPHPLECDYANLEQVLSDMINKIQIKNHI